MSFPKFFCILLAIGIKTNQFVLFFTRFFLTLPSRMAKFLD